ncbi:hypothetical protein [Thermofilum sp.]
MPNIVKVPKDPRFYGEACEYTDVLELLWKIHARAKVPIKCYTKIAVNTY